MYARVLGSLVVTPKHLAAGTFDSYMGRLRAIFNQLGTTGFSNPLAHSCVKEYLIFCKRGARSATFTTPSGCPFVLQQVHANSLSPLSKYLLVRDITFFVGDFYTGDRTSDLGHLRADQLFHLKDSEGFLCNFTLSKTRCAGEARPLTLLHIPNVNVCPVFWLNYYTGALAFLFSVSTSLGLRNIRRLSHITSLEVQAQLHDSKSILRRHALMTERPLTFSVDFLHPQGFGLYPRADWRGTDMALH